MSKIFVTIGIPYILFYSRISIKTNEIFQNLIDILKFSKLKGFRSISFFYFFFPSSIVAVSISFLVNFFLVLLLILGRFNVRMIVIRTFQFYFVTLIFYFSYVHFKMWVRIKLNCRFRYVTKKKTKKIKKEQNKTKICKHLKLGESTIRSKQIGLNV